MLKTRIMNDEKIVGTFINVYSPALVEMFGYAGFDFIVIDDEHGGFSDSELEQLIRAAECANIEPIVRVSNNPSSIQKALDRGAKGIQVPMVNTKEDALLAVSRAKYPPEGTRGATYSIRPARFGRAGGTDYLSKSNEETLVVVQIETETATENIEEILSVEGIDVVFVGPLDLAVTTGASSTSDIQIKQMVKNLSEQCKQYGKPAGTIAPKKADIEEVSNQNFQYIVSVANAMINETLDHYLDEWNRIK